MVYSLFILVNGHGRVPGGSRLFLCLSIYAAQVLVSCKQQVDDAVKALDRTAADVILNPYLSGIARSLEEIMSRMHR